MKYTFTLFSLFIALSVFGQTDFSKQQDLINTMAKYATTPQAFNLGITARSSIELTHNLDSIVNKTASSFVTGKQVMYYNTNGTTRQMDQYELDSTTAQLTLQSIFSFAYGANQLPNNLLVESLNEETQEFEESIAIALAYDGADQVDSVVVSLEDPFSGGFGPLLGIKYVYDGELLLQTRQWYYVAILGGWIPASITNFMYDGQDRLVEQQTSVLDFATQQIVPSSGITYAYNAEGLADTVVGYIFVDPNWMLADRSILEYYSNETMSSELYQVHDGSDFVNNTWLTYPVENVVDQYPTSTYQWDLQNNTWEILDSTNNLLNPDLQWSQVAAPKELGILAVLGEVDGNQSFYTDGSVTDEIHYQEVDSITLVLEPVGKEYYYYSLRGGASVSTVLPEYLAVTPNPAQNQFTISFDQNINANYVIYTTNGNETARGILNQGTNTVQTSSWPQGMYYVIITLEDGRTFAHKQLIQ